MAGMSRPHHRRSFLREATALALAGTVLPAWAQPASVAAEEARAPEMPVVGATLRVPPIALLDGTRFEFAGTDRPVLIYWWASTCPFCALQSPAMEAFWRENRGRFHFLGLSIDRRADLATAYLKTRGYTFPSAWASPEWRKQFPKPKGLPITIVLDRQGKVLAAERGQMFPEDVAALSAFLG
jgi:thiol-disulfide isomerase/thioredoxin